MLSGNSFSVCINYRVHHESKGSVDWKATLSSAISPCPPDSPFGRTVSGDISVWVIPLPGHPGILKQMVRPLPQLATVPSLISVPATPIRALSHLKGPKGTR